MGPDSQLFASLTLSFPPFGRLCRVTHALMYDHALVLLVVVVFLLHLLVVPLLLLVLPVVAAVDVIVDIVVMVVVVVVFIGPSVQQKASVHVLCSGVVFRGSVQKH